MTASAAADGCDDDNRTDSAYYPKMQLTTHRIITDPRPAGKHPIYDKF